MERFGGYVTSVGGIYFDAGLTILVLWYFDIAPSTFLGVLAVCFGAAVGLVGCFLSAVGFVRKRDREVSVN